MRGIHRLLNIKGVLMACLAVVFLPAPVCGVEFPGSTPGKAMQSDRNERHPATAVDYKALLSILDKVKPRTAELITATLLKMGKENLDQGKTKQALEIMSGLYQKNPQSLPVARGYAVALLKDGRYRESIAVLEEAAALDKSFAAQARYYMGLAKYMSGDVGAAVDDLAAAKDLGARSDEGRSADRLLADLEKRVQEISGMERQAAVTAMPGQPTKEKPWAVSLSAGMEYDSNVALIPSEQTRPEDISSEGDWRAVYSLNGVCEFVNTGRNVVGVNAGIYGTQQVKDDMFNVQNGLLSVYYKGNIADTFQVRLTPFVSQTLLKFSSHSWSYGATPGVSWQPVPWTWTDLNYTYSKVQFTDAPQYPEEDRSGKTQHVDLRQNFSFPSLIFPNRTTFVAGWLNYVKSDTDGSSYANKAKGFGLLVQQEFPADFTFLVSYSYAKTDYENANIRSATNEKRDDKSQTFSANLFKKLNMIYTNLSAYLGYRWFKNASNIANYYSYVSQTYSVGLTLDF